MKADVVTSPFVVRIEMTIDATNELAALTYALDTIKLPEQVTPSRVTRLVVARPEAVPDGE